MAMNVWKPLSFAGAAGVLFLAGCTGCASHESKPVASAGVSGPATVTAAHPAPAVTPQGARLDEYVEHGKPAGLQLREIAPGSDWARLGLKDGDVVTGVNGDPVTGKQDTGLLWSVVQSGEGS